MAKKRSKTLASIVKSRAKNVIDRGKKALGLKKEKAKRPKSPQRFKGLKVGEIAFRLYSKVTIPKRPYLEADHPETKQAIIDGFMESMRGQRQ